MAGLKEQAKWEAEIYRIEENDPVWGGEDGTTNKPTKQLANRTLYLKQQVEKRASTTQVGQVQLTNDTGLDSETLALTAKAGKALAQQIAQNRLNATNLANQKVDKAAISDSVTSTSQTTVATSKAVKTAFDKGQEGLNKANDVDRNTLKKTGEQSLSGILRFNAQQEGHWSAMQFGAKQGFWQVEMHPDSHQANNRRFNFLYQQGSERFYLGFPSIGAGETVAYQSWVSDQINAIPTPPNASTTRRGLAQYTDNVNFDSSDWGASAKALRTVNLKAEAAQTSANNAQNSANTAQTLANRAQTSANTAQTSANNANNNANNRVAKSGDTMMGHLYIRTTNSDYSGVHLFNKANKKLVLEANPDSETNSIGNFIYRDGNDANTQAVLKLPKKNGTLATEEEVNEAKGLAHNAQTSANTAQTSANNANNNANNRVAKSGDTMTGHLYIRTTNSDYSGVHLFNKANKKLVLEANPDSETNSIGNFIYRDGNDANTQAVLKLPKKNGTLATIEEVNNRVAKTGDTMTGTLTINTNEPRIHGNKNGQNGWFVGYPNSTSNDAMLHSYTNDTSLRLAQDRIEFNKPLYVGGNTVPQSLNSHKVQFRWNGNLELKVDATEVGRLIVNTRLPNEIKAHVSRRDYSQTRKMGQRDYTITGSVIVYPDGRIVQIFHLKSIQFYLFPQEDAGTGGYGGERQFKVSIPLWTAMPNRVINVYPQVIRATNEAKSQNYHNEAGEWIVAWQLFRNMNTKDRVDINTSRLRGSTDEPIDLYVVVEGY